MLIFKGEQMHVRIWSNGPSASLVCISRHFFFFICVFRGKIVVEYMYCLPRLTLSQWKNGTPLCTSWFNFIHCSTCTRFKLYNNLLIRLISIKICCRTASEECSSKWKKTFLVNSQYINQHHQSTVETVMAISTTFFNQMSEIKRMHTMGSVVVVKIYVYLLDVLCPRQASPQSDQSLRCPHEEPFGSIATHIKAHSKDSDQTGGQGWSESLLGAHVILLVLSFGGSFVISKL